MRLLILDSIRGLAFCFMFIFHIFVILKLFNYDINLHNNNIKYFGIIARNLFILLFGISLHLSYINSSNIISFKKKILNKSKLLIQYSIIITIITYLLIPDKYIVFGILHFLSISILILYNFINNINILCIIFISIFIFNIINTNISQYSYLISFFIPYYKDTIDHFYIFNWINIIIIGIFISHIIHKYNFIKKIKQIQSKHNLFSLIGQNSLQLYILHWPLLYLLLKLFLYSFS